MSKIIWRPVGQPFKPERIIVYDEDTGEIYMDMKKPKYAQCSYNNWATKYTWFCPYDNLKEGDKLIVRDKNGYSIVTFHHYTDKPGYANNWVVDKLDIDECEAKIDHHLRFFLEE